VDRTPGHFVFDVNEMRHQEWADRKEKTCYVPAEHTDDEVLFPRPRSGKRITLVGPDGSFLKPLIIIHRKTDNGHVALTGLTDEKIAIYPRPKGFIEGSIFWAWFEDVFIPEICQRRAGYELAGNIVVLLDNCTDHTFPSFESLCTPHGITICRPCVTVRIRHSLWMY
jgi:hypothetical protein